MEQNMEENIEKRKGKKKTITILGVMAGAILIVAAAFIGGRLLSQRTSPGGLLMAGNGASIVSLSLDFVPAPELPTTDPEVIGTYVEQQDNTVYVQTFSMDTGGAGVVISSALSSSGDPSVAIPAGAAAPAGGSDDSNSAPMIEVVVTNKTLIYKDVTQFDLTSTDENQTVQQSVETGSLDDLTSQTMITVWGRKVGDRVIADIILYSNPVVFTAP